MSREAREVVFLIAGGEDCVVGMGLGASSVRIDDSRSLWDQIWENRHVLTEIAHSHPVGPGAFSGTDLDTAEGLRIALGKPFYFSVVHPGGLLRRQVFPDGTHGPDEHVPLRQEPWWASLLWNMSESFRSRNAPEGGQGASHDHDHDYDDHDPPGEPDDRGQGGQV